MAHHLMMATTMQSQVDILFVSEQNRDINEEDGWYSDTSGRSAIAVLRNLPIDVIGDRNLDFRWVQISGV